MENVSKNGEKRKEKERKKKEFCFLKKQKEKEMKVFKSVFLFELFFE